MRVLDQGYSRNVLINMVIASMFTDTSRHNMQCKISLWVLINPGYFFHIDKNSNMSTKASYFFYAY